MRLNLNSPAPDFSLLSTANQPVKLSELRGKKVILYFYPRDNTPGCTKQGLAFSQHFAELTKLNTVVLGISRDSLQSHQKFKTKYEFPFELLSDPQSEVCELYQVIKDKNMYGKQLKGIERSTFLIDSQGVLRQVWRKVKVDGHVEEVLASLEAID